MDRAVEMAAMAALESRSAVGVDLIPPVELDILGNFLIDLIYYRRISILSRDFQLDCLNFQALAYKCG